METVLKIAGLLYIKTIEDEHDALFLENSELDESVAELLESLNNQHATVRFWVSDKQLSEKKIKELFIRKVCGIVDVDFKVRYSEITGYLWTDEKLVVGGHDLIAELSQQVDNYLHLEAIIHGDKV